MLRRLKFRHRIGLLVALAAAGLATTTVVTLVLGNQREQQLEGIETRYVPLLELDRDLGTTFIQIARALEDAAAAAEDSRIADADDLDRELVQHLRAGAATIAANGGDAAALEREYRAYYKVAREVATATVAGASAADVATQIEVMRRTRTAFAAHLDTATAPDRRRLAEAFATARRSHRNAVWITIIVAIGALVLMTLLSWRITQRTVQLLNAVAVGVERLARGELGPEIPVETTDELGDLAREANRTAVRLREYRDALEARNTTLVSAQQLLEERAAELARASRYKSEFLANMSHELRTPLNSIMILSQLLATNADKVLTDKYVEFATLIHRSGEELLALINEVLDHAKVEAGQQSMAFAPVQLAAIQDYLRRMFQPLAAQKQLGFEVELVGELPAEIRTDWARLSQVLKNLLANALKFTAKGTVTVRIARLGESEIRISVADSGIGIAADKQAWIFEAFAQADTGTARTYGGTGLGLTIARELAIRLGGSLRVESTLGTGSTFHLALPIAGPGSDDAPAREPAAAVPDLPATAARAPTAAPAGDDHDAADAVLDGRSVLIVDHDMRSVFPLANALRGKHLHVLTAANADDALAELDRHPDIELVVVDVGAGPDTIRRLRARAGVGALTLIAVSAHAVTDERERWLAAGATEYVAKPVDLHWLLALLRMLTSQRDA